MDLQRSVLKIVRGVPSSRRHRTFPCEREGLRPRMVTIPVVYPSTYHGGDEEGAQGPSRFHRVRLG